MFDALLHGRVDTEGLTFDLHLADIEELNRAALASEADVSKLSYALLPQVCGVYRVLSSGSALGRGNGPLLVAAQEMCTEQLSGLRVAIPGRETTANLLLNKLFPQIGAKSEYLFSEVSEAVLSGVCAAGVLIHEGRFTYRERGLHLVADLGLEWEKQTNLPLPLGAIVVSRRLPVEVQRCVDRVLRRSVAYAMAHPAASADFVKQHAQELSDEVTSAHIALFVNDYSLDLGSVGRAAVVKLLGLTDEEVFV